MNVHKICRWLLAAVVAAIIAHSSASAQNEEFRGLWVDAWGTGFLNASQVTQLVQDARTHNFNAIVVQMRRRGDAFYMPQAPNQDPRTTVISSSYDALADLIAQAHSGTPRIEVHCWVTTNLIWSNQTTPPSQAGHMYNQHPEYLMKSSSGATYIGEGYYADPGHPDAMKWTYNMAKDIVTNYAIDGFHWDYVRYPAQDSGYNDTAIARYNAEFGLTGQPSPSDAQFSAWRRRQVSDFLRWTNADLYEIRPNLVISTAVFASRSDAYTHRFQDWSAWNNDGILDISMPMNYSSTNSTFNSRVDDAYNHQGVRVAFVGQGAYLNTKENTVTQLSYVRNKPMWGTVFYSYRVPNSGTVDRAGTLAYVRDNYQPTWVNTPDLPWKANPDSGIVKGRVTRADTGEIVYNATVSIDAGPGFSQKSCVQGSYGFYDADGGTWTVTATAPGFGQAIQSVNVVPGQVVTINLILPEEDPGGPVADIVIDNPEASAAGSWTVGTAAADKYGVSYHWKSQGTGAAYLQYTPQIQTAGTYHVYTWHPQGANRTVGAPHVVTHLDGTATVTVNQTVNGGQWNYVGTYPFEVGSSGHVRITDGFADAGQVVIADAISFVFDAPFQTVPDDIVIDNPESLLAGSWTTGTAATDKYGSDYYFKGQGTGSAYAQFVPSIQVAGDYHVFTWHAQGANRTGGAPHVVNHELGTDTVYINQQVNGGQWNYVGTYPFAAGSSGHVRITDAFADAGQVVMADGISFVYSGASPPPPPPPPLTVVHVESIAMAQVAAGGPWSRVRATVEVRDSGGAVVPGATVTGNFTGAIAESGVSAVTGSDGKAVINSTGKARSGMVTFTVTDVSGSDLDYDASSNVQTSGNISF